MKTPKQRNDTNDETIPATTMENQLQTNHARKWARCEKIQDKAAIAGSLQTVAANVAFNKTILREFGAKSSR